MKKLPLTIKLLILLAFLSVVSFRPFGCVNDITGTVKDVNGQALQGTVVILELSDVVISSTTVTENGDYIFSEVEYSNYTIKVSSSGYHPTARDIGISYFDNGLACKNMGGDFILIQEDEEEVGGGEEVYSWKEIGIGSASANGISDSLDQATYPSTVVDDSGFPIVAWRDSGSGNEEVYIKKWNGSSWMELGNSASGGGISNSGGSLQNPSIAVDNSNHPVVVWEEQDEIYLKQWNGSNWIELDGSATGEGINDHTGRAEYPKVAIKGDGYPVVTWQANLLGDSQVWNIYVKQWNGTSWEVMGSSSASGGGISDCDTSYGAKRPDITINYSGNPIIVWQEVFSSDAIRHSQWSGSIWEGLGTNGSWIMNYGELPSISINSSGYIFVAVINTNGSVNDILLRQYNTYQWEPLGESDTGEDGLEGCVGVDSAGIPMVLYGESSDVFLMKWNIQESMWDSIDYSNNNYNVSNTPGASTNYSMTVNNSGNPIVVWQDDSSGSNEIYIRQWATE